MSDLSPEALARLQAQEKSLHEKWGRTSGILMSAIASALFVNGVVSDPENKAETFFDILEGVFSRIVPKEHQDRRDEVLADVDALLLQIFSEHYPDKQFEIRRNEDHGVEVIGSPLSSTPIH